MYTTEIIVCCQQRIQPHSWIGLHSPIILLMDKAVRENIQGGTQVSPFFMKNKMKNPTKRVGFIVKRFDRS